MPIGQVHGTDLAREPGCYPNGLSRERKQRRGQYSNEKEHAKRKAPSHSRYFSNLLDDLLGIGLRRFVLQVPDLATAVIEHVTLAKLPLMFRMHAFQG